jgi:hypothetical protein
MKATTFRLGNNTAFLELDNILANYGDRAYIRLKALSQTFFQLLRWNKAIGEVKNLMRLHLFDKAILNYLVLVD